MGMTNKEEELMTRIAELTNLCNMFKHELIAKEKKLINLREILFMMESNDWELPTERQWKGIVDGARRSFF